MSARYALAAAMASRTRRAGRWLPLAALVVVLATAWVALIRAATSTPRPYAWVWADELGMAYATAVVATSDVADLLITSAGVR